ncbi:MAG: XrtA system polysaccharide deacetylase [Gemmatimonadales bacterium]
MTLLAPRTPAVHLFTVDVEEHFQVVAFQRIVSRGDWDRHPSRVVANTERLLDLLAEHRVRGTFFTLGWVAEKYPRLVRRIAEAGHEVASHGCWHQRVTSFTPEEFRADLRLSKAQLEQASGQRCLGFRAPSFSIVPGLEWAFDALLEEGYRYDSSLFPIRRPDYGYPDAPPVPHWLTRPAGRLLELPLATTTFGTLRLPAAGGGYLRQFPLGLIRRGLREWGAQGVSAMFYVHPWEYDVDQPRIPCGWFTALRHYRNLDRTWPRMQQLLSEFAFTSVADRYAAELGLPASVVPAGGAS